MAKYEREEFGVIPIEEGQHIHWTGIVDIEQQHSDLMLLELYPAGGRDGSAWFVQSSHTPGFNNVQKRALSLEGVCLYWSQMFLKIPETLRLYWTGEDVEPKERNPFLPAGAITVVHGEYRRWNGIWDVRVEDLHKGLEKEPVTTCKVQHLREGDTFYIQDQPRTLIEGKRGQKYRKCTYTSDGVTSKTCKLLLDTSVDVRKYPPFVKAHSVLERVSAGGIDI